MTIQLHPVWKRRIVAAAAIIGVIAAVVVYDRLFRERAAPSFESDEDHFLYGSIGAESREGVPYWIWLVLPRIFPDLLPGPGGYASLGIVARDGRELPVGFSNVTIGYPRVATNCAFCHAASVRTRGDDVPAIVPGGPAHQTSAQQYLRFLTTAAADPRFNAGMILGEIAKNYRLSLLDRLIYRFAVIPGTRERLLRLRDQNGWMDERPEWGHGRADVVNPIKFGRLGQPPDSSVATADMMPLWNMLQRESDGLFWDGLNVSLQDAVVTSALSTGASRPWLDDDMAKWEQSDPQQASSLRRVYNYITTLKPPAYPFAVDKTRAAAGEAVYRAECARCHLRGGAGADVRSVNAADTDDRRLGAWTSAASAALDAFSARRVWASPGFRAGERYVPVPLDGLWLRAPYLHNGSVPSLDALLSPPQNRPSRFWRGYDVYDPVSVGFVSDGPDAQRYGRLHDTSQPGNGNAGHDYGTALPPDARLALLEYLKTL